MIAAYVAPATRRPPLRAALVVAWAALAAAAVAITAFVQIERDRAAAFLADPPRTARAVSGIPFASLVNAAASRYHLDPSLVAAVVVAESGFRADAVSPRGARGLMQVMPATFREALPAGGCPARADDPCLLDPEQNLRAGASHLSALLRRFGGDATLALAAYNAGHGQVERHQGVPPFPETRLFVERVSMAWRHLHATGTLTPVALRLVTTYDAWARVQIAVLGAIAALGLAAAWRR